MESPICRICKVFFGCQEGLCSRCFKESKVPPRPEPIVTPIVVKMAEETKVEKPSEVVKADRCFSCKKLLGPMGFRCKCCNFYCTRHRHPEDHRCEYDHKTEAIKKLTEDNPLVQAPKFNKL